MTAYRIDPRAASPLTEQQIANWFGDGCPRDLAEQAAYKWRYCTGMQLGVSPASTVRQMMDTLRPRAMAPREPVEAEQWPDVAQRANTVTDLSGVFGDVPGYRYLHAYDRNGMYLAACSSVELGLGAFRHYAAPAGFEPQTPGYWRFGERWYMTPEAAYLRCIDALGEPDEAWVWLRHGRALSKWQQTLRDARSTLRQDHTESGQLAYAALKEGYTRAIGWLCGYWFNPAHPDYRPSSGGFASAAYRPDWRHAIVATARANMLRALHKIGQHSQIVAAHIDQVYIASNDPSADWEALGLTIGGELGEWSIRYSGVPMDAVRHCLDGTHSALQLDNACEEWEAANQ